MQYRLGVLASLSIVAVLGIAWTVYANAPAQQEQQYATYTNDRWGFSLIVPAEMVADEYDREGGGQAIDFSGDPDHYPFTISAWPYTQYDLTFAREVAPGAAGEQPGHLEIVDVMRDDTLTFLFKRNGVFYVVRAIPEDERWIADILTTWRFAE